MRCPPCACPRQARPWTRLGVLDGAGRLVRLLDLARGAAALVFACPFAGACEAAVRAGDGGSLASRFEVRWHAPASGTGCARRAAPPSKPLASWFRGEWLAELEGATAAGASRRRADPPCRGAPRLAAAYQRFRSRAARAAARGGERCSPPCGSWRASWPWCRRRTWTATVRRTLRREALLAAKGRLEALHPELLYWNARELEAKVAALAVLDRDMRALNRELLGGGLERGPARHAGGLGRHDPAGRAAEAAPAGAASTRGPELGLMHLRPVWLMNPDVASRVLPLKAGLFDLVIYDEASQMPVEHAVPTLYRARRAVVSGDEKQMPPSSFFSGAVEDDDEDEAGRPTRPRPRRSGWRWRRAGTGARSRTAPTCCSSPATVLPSTTLQIHYRSNYRELIGFSNAAYYGGAPERARPPAGGRRSGGPGPSRWSGWTASTTAQTNRGRGRTRRRRISPACGRRPARKPQRRGGDVQPQAGRPGRGRARGAGRGRPGVPFGADAASATARRRRGHGLLRQERRERPGRRARRDHVLDDVRPRTRGAPSGATSACSARRAASGA